MAANSAYLAILAIGLRCVYRSVEQHLGKVNAILQRSDCNKGFAVLAVRSSSVKSVVQQDLNDIPVAICSCSNESLSIPAIGVRGLPIPAEK